LAEPASENGLLNHPRTPHAVLPSTFDGDHPIPTGLLWLADAWFGSYLVNSPSGVLTNLGDGIIISTY